MSSMTMPDPTDFAAAAHAPQVIGTTALGARVSARLTYDNTGGRGWDVYVEVDGRLEKVASATAEKRFGSDAVEARVNWSAWGAQRPSVAANVADALNFAARLATRTKNEIDP